MLFVGGGRLLLTKGVNPKVVSERLGHASVIITLNRYSHAIEGLQAIAADALDAPRVPPKAE